MVFQMVSFVWYGTPAMRIDGSENISLVTQQLIFGSRPRLELGTY
jgi:hypothetical protein